ncbi:Mitogen-activated protein kinase-binding protein 1 [Halotydeus destructor]|nr:Mitogen-activated protein kinase-binding protein 1 [Halotydeus destructor]
MDATVNSVVNGQQSSNGATKTVIRNLALKRNKSVTNLYDKVKLDRILGITVCSNSSLDSDPNTCTVAYPAGCVTVLYNVRKNKQSHIVNSSKKTLTCLSYSPDGQYLVTGECGHQPHVRIWDVQSCSQIAEFPGHKYGINCVAFSPNMKYVVSVGSQHDMIVNVWDWKLSLKVASNKVSAKVRALSFASDGSYFVTVGNRHVKFWYLDYSRPRTTMEAMPLTGRSAILGEQRNNNFCDVGCGQTPMSESTYAITESGLLCEFNNRRLLDKWVELRTTGANCLSVGEKFICVGCAEGIVRVFNPSNLHFVCTLPRPHALGTDLSKTLLKNDLVQNGQDTKYADTVAITLDETNTKVTCVYKDRSIYIWDIRDMKRVGKAHSFLYHSACIWGVETFPTPKSGAKGLLPPGTFMTCSSDDTIRIWNLEGHSQDSYIYKRNIFSDELLKILYFDPELNFLCDSESSSEKTDTTYDGKNGVRCLRISADGRKLASGDRSGNIRVYDLASQQDICKIEAHDSEVLCLEYSVPDLKNGSYYLASASRDRLIHLFDVNKQYSFVQTFDDHNASITATKFVQNEDKSSLQLISCGADKSIIFRKINLEQKDSIFAREHYVVGKCTFYDMDVDKEHANVLTACQDRLIRVYNSDTGKYVSSFKGSNSEEGTLIKMEFDPSGTYLATSSTDKSLSIYDYQSGECLAVTSGHSELITGLKFTPNGRNLISVSGDGCVFIWKLPSEMSNTIACKIGLPPVPEKPAHIASHPRPLSFIKNEDKPEEAASLKINNIAALPAWAKKQLKDEGLDSSSGESEPHSISTVDSEPRKNRWTQRIENTQSIIVKSYLSSDPVINYPSSDTKSDGKTLSPDHQPSSSPKPLPEEIAQRRLSDASRSANEDASGSDVIYYPPSEASSRGPAFEVQQYNDETVLKNGKSRIGGPGRLSTMGLMNSLSVPNFNELHSDDDEDTNTETTETAEKVSTKNPLYMSIENLDRNEQRHNNFLRNNHFDDESKTPRLNGDYSARASFSAKHMSKTPINVSSGTPLAPLSRTSSASTVSGKPPISKRKEEMTKAITEARKKLETRGWKGSSSSLSNSKSVADISVIPGRSKFRQTVSSNDEQSEQVRRSTSLVDLAPRKKLFSMTSVNLNASHGTAAPLWESRNSDNASSQDLLKKSSSIASLSKEPLSQVAFKGQGPWGTPSPLNSQATPVKQFTSRSGRASAPLQTNRQSIRFAGDSSDDETSSSGTVSPFSKLHRPGTPPKPSILRQIRRSSTSQALPSASSAPKTPESNFKAPGTKPRRIWDNFELRSTKSEYNLSFAGKDPSRKLGSANSTKTIWGTPAENPQDMSPDSPSSAPLTKDNCKQIVNELKHYADCTKRLYEQALASGDSELCKILSDGISRAQNSLSKSSLEQTAKPPGINGSASTDEATSLPPEATAITMNLLQQYSDRLLNMMEQRFSKEKGANNNNNV